MDKEGFVLFRMNDVEAFIQTLKGIKPENYDGMKRLVTTVTYLERALQDAINNREAEKAKAAQASAEATKDPEENG